VRVVRVDHAGREALHQLRKAPRGGEVDLVPRRKRDELAGGGAAPELAVGVRDQCSAVTHGIQTGHRQQDLVLSAAPAAGGVNVKGKHENSNLEFGIWNLEFVRIFQCGRYVVASVPFADSYAFQIPDSEF